VITLLRLALGTLVYAVIVVLAAPFPSAAGLLLTFPALNGLAFFFSPRADVAAVARTMLCMPIINGALCAIYIAALLALGDRTPPVATAWVLIAAIVGAWCAIVPRKTVRTGIPDGRAQLVFGLIVTLAGAALVWASLAWLDGSSLLAKAGRAAAAAPTWQSVGTVLWAARLKLGLFAACLALFLLATSYFPIPPAVRGILAGLPIVPFGGLVSVAADAGLAERLQVLARMETSVWFGPAIATWFVYGYAQFLLRRRPNPSPAADGLARFAGLIVGWLACGRIIIGVAHALDAIARTVVP
jgi:hypothetical protein